MRKDPVSGPEDWAIDFVVKEELIEDFRQERHVVRFGYRKITSVVE